MHNEPKIDINLSHRLLDQKHPMVPAANRPCLENLRALAQQRRTIRLRRRFVVGAAISTCLIAFVSLRLESLRRDVKRMPLASQRERDSLDQRLLSVALNRRDSNANPEIRGYARVRRPVPLFGMDETTQTLHHVGWTSSDQLVPVDMSRFSDEQLATMEAVLEQSPSVMQYNL